jgi:predicted dehydrogenase
MQARSALLVGGGAVGIDHHLPRIRGLLGIERVCVVEPDPARRRALEARFARSRGLRVAPAIPDPAAPAGERLALAVIASPPRFHLEGYQGVAARAEQVLIEKPIAADVASAERIAAQARASGQRVLVNLIRRALGAYRLIRELRRERTFGELERVVLAEGSVFRWPSVSLAPFSRELGGGGVLMDTGPHALDLLLQVFQGLALERAWMDASAPAVEANCTLELIGDAEIPVELVLSRNRNLSNTARFQFSEALLRAGVRDERIEVIPRRGSPYEIRPVGGGVDASFAGLFDAFYRRFLLARDPEGPGPDESLAALRIIERAYQIAHPMPGAFA